MEQLSPEVELEIFKECKYAVVYWAKSQPHTAIIEAIATYIPIEEFKELFTRTEVLVQEKKISKLIFDKRQLKVFHQPSMEWYFVQWKEKMAELGLVKHVKILPNDEVFRQSVRIGRMQINNKYPTAKFNELEIVYAQDMTEALTL